MKKIENIKVYDTFIIKLNINSTRKANKNTKLGFINQPFYAKLNTLVVDEIVSCINVVIIKIYSEQVYK